MAEGWLTALRRACDESSQAAVARRLRQADGYPSPALINQVLAGKYTRDTARLQGLVEGLLMRQTVDCPVLGDIGKNKCLEHQARPRRFATANPLFVRLWKACRSGCPHSKLPREY